MEELIKKINKFRDERDWRQFHNPKDLSISVMLEAAELVEKFQWKDSQEALEKDRVGIEEEIADCFIYLMMLSDDLNLNIETMINSKLDDNKKKYPIKKSKGTNKKYTEFK